VTIVCVLDTTAIVRNLDNGSVSSCVYWDGA